MYHLTEATYRDVITREDSFSPTLNSRGSLSLTLRFLSKLVKNVWGAKALNLLLIKS